MTDRYNYLTVAMEKDIRDDDCQPLIEAIKMLRGVVDVTPHVVDGSAWAAEVRVRDEMREKVWRLFYPKEKT